jgi:putative nucleotidyltransferase with HDIG domain
MDFKGTFLALQSRLLYFSWTVLLILIYLAVAVASYDCARNIALSEAKISIGKDMLHRSWIASHGGIYVSLDENTSPNQRLSHIKDRDFEAIGKKFTLMNHEYALSQIMGDYSKRYGAQTRATSKLLLNPKNRPDQWEIVALDKVEQTRDPYYELDDIEGEEYFRLMKPMTMKKECLKCHSNQGYEVGDVGGGASVAIPMKELYENAFKQSAIALAAFSFLWSLGMIAIYLYFKNFSVYVNGRDELYERYSRGLVNMMEQKNSYTAGHSSRVAHYSKLIAKEMRLSDSDCELVRKAATLHDIGKIGIEDSVFFKPSKLNADERKRVQEHVELSYKALSEISIFDDVKEIVRNHHERYDGGGYPRGTLGQKTPLLAQILAQADAFDAMTTHRVYKNKKSISEAFKEISELSGKQFNPEIVKATLEALKDIVIDQNNHDK